MAERRMFAKTIVDSDAFLDMPATSQLLYFHLSMRADDDGFINNAKKIIRMVRLNDDDFNILVAKKFIIPFESGIVVIKHWRIHNYIRNDRYKATKYVDEKSQLVITENNSYSLDKSEAVFDVDTNGIPNGYRLDTQDRLGKDRLGKDRLGKDRLGIEFFDFDEIPGIEINDSEVNEKFNQYLVLLKKIGTNVDQRRAGKLLKDLFAITTDKNLQIKVIQQSIDREWKGLYPIKNIGSFIGAEEREKKRQEIKEEFEKYKKDYDLQFERGEITRKELDELIEDNNNQLSLVLENIDFYIKKE